MLRALAGAGAEALREQALDQGYARLAKSRNDDIAERRALRNRAAKRAEARNE